MPFKTWAIGEEVLAGDFQPMVQEQVVATFPSTAARDAAIVAPKPGQCCYVVGVGFQIYGTSWQAYSSPRGVVVSGTNQAAPNAAQQLPLTTVIHGPASWLGTNMITLPADAGGLYLLSLVVAYTSPTVAAIAFGLRNAALAQYSPLMLTGGMVAAGNPTNHLHGSWLRQCVGGDGFRVYNEGNTMTGGQAGVERFSLVRVGDALAGF